MTGDNRTLHCVQERDQDISIWDLSDFKCISKIRLDWLSHMAMPCPKSFEDDEKRLPFLNVESHVIELDIRGLTWPSPMAVSYIGKTLPYVRTLKLRQRRIWCGLCYTCNVSRFRAPGPGSIVYEGGLGLPVSRPPCISTPTTLTGHEVALQPCTIRPLAPPDCLLHYR